MSDAYRELMQRPDIEQAQEIYTTMLTTIRERLTAELGRAWKQGDDLSGSGCGNGYPGLDADGEIRRLPRWDSPGNLPDAQWPRAQELVGQIAATYGFNPAPKVFKDAPSNHDVVYRKSDGALLNFGTGKNTSVRVDTGCHLTVEAHRRGSPSKP
ncbi:LppA family lipoprotein [Amycolatopsis minnesotensis]|uniref:LppA family lipoprotein n=1 Tax=Amycolatopsis minnesotensis TaxID=337894 RepID=UPI0031D8E706